MEVVRRNLAFEENPEGFYKLYEEKQRRLREGLERARRLLPEVEVPRRVMEGIAEACSRLEVEGLRSDLAVIRAAKALAALEGRRQVEEGDVLEVFDLAISHRIREGPRRRSTTSVLREVLLGGVPGEVLERPVRLKPSLEMPPSEVSAPYIKRMRRRRLPLGWMLHAVVVAALLFALSFILSMLTLFLRAMMLNQPITEAMRSMTPRLLSFHLAIVSSLFLLISILFPRKVVRPVVYLYTYLGSGLRRRIVLRQSHPVEREEVKRPMEASTIINIPVIASLRRLYRVLVGKGAKLLEAKGRKRFYKFEMVRHGERRLRGGIGRQSKMRARSRRGFYVSYEYPKEKPWDVAIGPTIRAAAPHQPYRERRGLALRVEVDDIRVKVREMRAPLTVVLLLDMSESMIPSLPNVRNAILSMRDLVFRRRDRLGLIVFKGEGAVTLQTPTTNIDLVVRRLRDVGASDLTPLPSGMFEAWRVLRNEKLKNKEILPILVIISDGIANIPLESPLSPHTRRRYINHAQADVIDVAYLLRREGIRTLVINPAHVEKDEVSERYKQGIEERTGKMWLQPKELLMEIPRITGGYYYGITERGELEEVLLTEAFTVLR
jgi:Mg-chelatase subunit ChlD